jgi:hypothetical protein
MSEEGKARWIEHFMEVGGEMLAAAERHRAGYSFAAKLGVTVKALFFFVRATKTRWCDFISSPADSQSDRG